MSNLNKKILHSFNDNRGRFRACHRKFKVGHRVEKRARQRAHRQVGNIFGQAKQAKDSTRRTV